MHVYGVDLAKAVQGFLPFRRSELKTKLTQIEKRISKFRIFWLKSPVLGLNFISVFAQVSGLLVALVSYAHMCE